MQTYQQLLTQFHNQQASILESDNHVQYVQLLNQLKLSKDKKIQARKRVKFESSRFKTQTDDIIKLSGVQKSLQISRFIEANDSFKEKRSLVELQSESLVQQIDYINEGFQKLKVQKELVESEIKMIDKKQIQITNAFCESTNNLEELRASIKLQKHANDRDFIFYDKKLAELTEKLQLINEQNVLNSKYYKHLNTEKVQSKNNTLVGTILFWQNEQTKLKKLPKKTYTKNQIESMLRALFLLSKFTELNYGNIIEHLIKMTDPTDECLILAVKSQKKIFLDQKGDEVEVKELISRLQAELLTPNQCKFLSKTKIVEFYANKGINISSDWETNNLSKQTVSIIQKVVAHFEKLTSWFSRIQKRNIQLSENFRSLQRLQEKLQKHIRSIQNSAVEKSINYLQSREQQIEHLHEKLNESCKVIFLFNINAYDLIKRFQNLNKFFDKIVKSTNRRTYKKTFIEIQEDSIFLKKITKMLFKSPQCIILDWNNVIKRVKTQSSFVSTGQMFEKMPQNEIYFQTIMKNDLLRIYAQPSMFDKDKSYIDNFQVTFNYVINEETQIVERLCGILQDLLLFSKNGIKEFEGYKIERKEEKKRLAIIKDKETQQKLNPLLRLLQQTDVKLDKFFSKDGIKEDNQDKKNNQNPIKQEAEQEGLCVQSNDFYRRDNFKLIQKLEKLNLKKRGLLSAFPFAVNTSLELQPDPKASNNMSYENDTSRLGSTRNSYRKRQPRLSHQLLSTRHNIISERRQKQSMRKKDLKDLLNNISNIASENQKYRIRKKLNSQQQSFSSSVSKIWLNRSKLD